VRYHVDLNFPGPCQFKGALRVTLKDGRTLDEVEEHNRGSAANPMSHGELRAKFNDNAGDLLSQTARDGLAGEIMRLERLPDASVLIALTIEDRR